ncbi:RHS repeat-associated core domain-containing protein [Nitrosomonas sp.]|uniref:RHS repeat-associated core domain-containing protein n=1 Tax=Nitrosomonas sp. TaxID=42353 RepID=UPI001DD98693|nr:RHS repeat-associated core domain-containing protein [Nitrosomonas sp.]MCB1948820.1 RHS repeat protein [Nitrosomonas sp.]
MAHQFRFAILFTFFLALTSTSSLANAACNPYTLEAFNKWGPEWLPRCQQSRDRCRYLDEDHAMRMRPDMVRRYGLEVARQIPSDCSTMLSSILHFVHRGCTELSQWADKFAATGLARNALACGECPPDNWHAIWQAGYPDQNLPQALQACVPANQNAGPEILATNNVLDPDANLGRPEACVSNPINAATGNKFAQETDIVLQSGLEFTRYYNSNSSSDSTQIGIAWQHTYQRSLNINSQTITATRPDGRVINFHLSGSSWVNQQAGGDALQLIDVKGEPLWLLTTSNGTAEAAEVYDTDGKLVTIVDRNRHRHILTYDTSGRMISVRDDAGFELVFTYHDRSERIATMTDPSGGLYQYTYDSDNNLTSVTYPDGSTRTYHYNEPAYTNNTNLPHALTGITDENGVRYATYTYDAQGRAIVTEHASGADRYELAYDTDSTTITDPLGSEYTRQFETILGLARNVSQSQPAGAGCSAASSETSYDAHGNLASRTDFNGNKTCYAFDLTRNLETARIEGLAVGSACPEVTSYKPAVNTTERKILTSWHSTFRLPIKITEAESEVNIDYDDHGNVTRLDIKDLETNTTRTWTRTYTYYHPSISGILTQRIDDGPRTDVDDITTFNYYAPNENCTGGHMGCRGQIASITNALGHVIKITRYNPHGQPEVITDPNGLTITLAYDARQRLMSRTVGTETTNYQYDGIGQLIRIIYPDKSKVHYTYDNARRLIQIADNSGNRIRYTLDAMGNRIQEDVFDPANTLTQTRQREFDALSRLWKAIGAENQTFEFGYDPEGNLKQATNPLQHTVANRFDGLNRLIQTTDPAGGQAQQDLDVLDQVTRVIDPKGIETTYTYNGLGDLIREVSADRGTTTYTYDAAGNVITRTDARGVVQSTTYDALNRPTSRTHTTVNGVPETAPITWSYDEGDNGIGRLTGMSDESGNTTYSYDLHGRLLNKVQTSQHADTSFTHSLGYQYDSSGRLSKTIYPSGAQIETIYGIDGRPSEIRVNGNVLIKNITYQPFGSPKSWTWGNGQAHVRSFDQDGRLTQYLLGSDTLSLSYDAASQITATTGANPAYTRSYGYDELGRLIRQEDNAKTSHWSYDANSNRTSVQQNSTVYPYTLDTNSNRLLSVAGPVAKTYNYDAAGNTLNDGISDYTWNAAGRLSQVTRDEATHSYQYNGHGERIIKSGAVPTSVPHIFNYDLARKLIGEYTINRTKEGESSWQLKQETIWLGNIPIAVLKRAKATDPIQVYFIHTDHLNTPRLIVDQSNTPVWRWSNINAFGANLPDENPDGNKKLFEYNLRFAGQYFDQETNLHYNYFRDYEPRTGRYLSSDPIGLNGGFNTYTYASNNPLMNSDPYGLCIWDVCAGEGGAAALAATVFVLKSAAVAAAIDVGTQVLVDGRTLDTIDWSDAGVAAVVGGVFAPVGGGIWGSSAARGAKVITTTVFGATMGVGEAIVQKGINAIQNNHSQSCSDDQTLTGGGILEDSASGVGGEFFGERNAVREAFDSEYKAVMRWMRRIF